MGAKPQKNYLQILEVSMNLKKSRNVYILDLESIYILEKVDFSSTSEVWLKMM